MISIQQLSKATNVTTRTLRYYDAIGLLHASGTTPGGHRLYTEKDVFKLQQIQFLKRTGLSLKDIHILLEDDHIDPIKQLEHQLQYIRSEKERLTRMEREITGLIHSYSIEGALNWSVIFNLVQHNQTNRAKMEQMREQWLGEKEQQVTSKLPNLNRGDDETKQWVEWIKELQRLVDQPPDSDEVQCLIGQISRKMEQLFQNDKQTIDQIWAIRKSPEKSEQLGWYPLDDRLLEFLDEAFTIFDRSQRGDTK